MCFDVRGGHQSKHDIVHVTQELLKETIKFDQERNSSPTPNASERGSKEGEKRKEGEKKKKREEREKRA